MSAITVRDALAASIVLDADNAAHAEDVRRVMSRSAHRGDVVIVDGSQGDGPAVASTVAKVMLDTLDVEFVRSVGDHSVWRAA